VLCGASDSFGAMITLGWSAAILGVALFHVALIITVRANPDTRIPFNRNAEITPTGSVALRVCGAGLIVLGTVLLGAALLGTDAWYWPFAVVLAGPIVATTVATFHNKKVAARAIS
jgi:hypothetical protein